MDAIKYQINRLDKVQILRRLPAFLVDQFMHIAIICIVWFVFFGKEVDYTLQ